MKRVVSVSLGTSKRDSKAVLNILSQEFEVSRVGTDGDMKKFAELLRELDGKVDAIGLGGCDRYLWVGNRRYVFREIDQLARIPKVTPVFDGSGVKHTLERKAIDYLQDNGIVDFGNKKVLVVCAVDRAGMAQAIANLTHKVVFGDLMFNLGIPIPMRSYSMVRIMAALLAPIITKLPFQWVYPTGEKQEKTVAKYSEYYGWADVIAGDYHLIKKFMPTVESGLLKGKVIITNTVTPEDKQKMIDRGVKLLVTATPESGGRYFATNVFEGVLVTLIGKKPEEITASDYDELLKRMNWKPTITDLTKA